MESKLERDLASLLEMDPRVDSFEEQPLEVFYEQAGRRVKGVPDFLVTYKSEFGLPPLLCDVKFRSEVFARWPVLKPRFRAAMRHAKQQGWHYAIMTEAEIRIPRLPNVRFLLRYLRRPLNEPNAKRLVATLANLRTATPRSLLQKCEDSQEAQAKLLPTLWGLIARGVIGADLDKKLTMSSEVFWLRGS